MKKVLFVLVILLMTSFAGNLQAQQSVHQAQKFAELCLKKVKKHRFKKLQEYYPEAMRDINKIITNTTDTRFGHDQIANLGVKWIVLMNTLERFPNQKLSFKGSVITFKIEDYRSIYEKAKAIACKDHYAKGVEIMNEFRNNYYRRQMAIQEFQKSLHYGSTYKSDIQQHAAAIYYDEGLRIYSSSQSFTRKINAGKPFREALKYVDPYKNTRELMAKLYYDEASMLLSKVPEPNQAVALMFKDPNTWPTMDQNLKNASAYFKTANTWLPDYKSCQAKWADVNNEAALILYEAGMKYAAIPSFQKQSVAARFLHDVGQWEPKYKDADEQAYMARERSTYVVIIAHANGTPVKPSEIQKKLYGYDYMLNPDVSNRIDLSLNNPENWPAIAKRLGRGFILVKMAHINHRAADFHYRVLRPEITSRHVVRYTKLEKGVETTISKSDYKAGKLLLSTVKNRDVGVSVHKYEGTVRTAVYEAELVGSIPLEIWDVRDPYKPVLLKILHTRKRAFDKVVKETYRGDPQARPRLIYQQRLLLTKADLMKTMHLYSITVPSLILRRSNSIANKIMSVVGYRD